MSKQHLIKRALAGGLVIAATGWPVAAQARIYAVPIGNSAAITSGSPVQHRLNQLQNNVRDNFGAAGGGHLVAPAVPATATSHSSFQWDDAGIGAGATVVLLGVGALGTTAARRRRQPAIG
jgi:hypothetical protein